MVSARSAIRHSEPTTVLNERERDFTEQNKQHSQRWAHKKRAARTSLTYERRVYQYSQKLLTGLF